jgi:hypothetical protein
MLCDFFISFDVAVGRNRLRWQEINEHAATLFARNNNRPSPRTAFYCFSAPSIVIVQLLQSRIIPVVPPLWSSLVEEN